MIAALCPKCGRPAPMSLERADALACAACGYRGPPDERARLELEKAAESLAKMDATRRQLDADQVKAVTRAREELRAQRTRAWICLAVATAAVTMFLGWAPKKAATWAMFLPVVAGVAVVAGLGAILLRSLRARLFVLETSWSARPPVEPGGAARCYVCGGPIVGEGAVVRCRYCSSDNLVDSAVLERLRASDEFVVDALEDFVVDRAGGFDVATTEVSRSITAVMITTVIVAPVFALLTCLVISALPFPLDTTIPYYVSAPAYGSPCACVHEGRQGGVTDERIDPETLIGKKVCKYGGALESLSGNPFEGNRAVVHMGIDTQEVKLSGLCFEGIGPKPPAKSR